MRIRLHVDSTSYSTVDIDGTEYFFTPSANAGLKEILKSGTYTVATERKSGFKLLCTFEYVRDGWYIYRDVKDLWMLFCKSDMDRLFPQPPIAFYVRRLSSRTTGGTA